MNKQPRRFRRRVLLLTAGFILGMSYLSILPQASATTRA